MVNIYLLRCVEDGSVRYKIGLTKNDVQKRVKQLQTGNSNPIDILKVVKVDKYWNSIEKFLHKKYIGKHEKLEWFNLDIEDIASFEDDIQKIYVNLECLELNSSLKPTFK